MNPFIGEIRIFGFNFPPAGWAQCNGQLLAIAANDALFALLGTTYGGDGVSTFALPDLRSRVPIHQGQGPGLSPYVIGQMAGVEAVTLTTSQIPQHNHVLNAFASTGTGGLAPSGGVPANTQGSVNGTANTTFAAPAIGPSGGSQPHENLQPYLTLNFCISLFGIFPSRN